MSKPVSLLLLLLLALCRLAAAPAEPGAGRPYLLYAQFVEDTKVDLSDGSQWAMDAGDCFPIYMFKDHQRKVVLKLGSATFMTDASHVKVLPESEAETAQASYRKNLETFLKGSSEKWKKDAH